MPRLGTPWYSNIYPARLEGGWQRIAPLSPFVGVAFDGHSDFVQLPPLADDFSQGFTVELWANIQASSSYARFLDIGNGAGLDSILFARDGATDSMYVHVFRENHAAPNGFVRAPNVLHIGVWQHVAATLRPTSNGMGRLTLYVNGEMCRRRVVVSPARAASSARANGATRCCAAASPRYGCGTSRARRASCAAPCLAG